MKKENYYLVEEHVWKELAVHKELCREAPISISEEELSALQKKPANSLPVAASFGF